MTLILIRLYRFQVLKEQISFFKQLFYLFIYLFLERGEGRETERETSMCGCLSCAPYWGPGPQPRHVPWLRIKTNNPLVCSPRSIHWATPARAKEQFFRQDLSAQVLVMAMSPNAGPAACCYESQYWEGRCSCKGKWFICRCQQRGRWGTHVSKPVSTSQWRQQFL